MIGQLASLPVPAAAKTGTAEDPSAPGKGLNAWFSAVLPFDAPEVVVTVLVRGGGFGSATAGPVVKRLRALPRTDPRHRPLIDRAVPRVVRAPEVEVPVVQVLSAVQAL